MADEKNEVDELRGEIDKLNAKNKELITELRKAKGSTNEEAARLADELDNAKAENVKLAGALKKATEGLEVAQREAAEKLTAKSGIIQKLIRDDGLLKGLTESGVKKELLAGALALHAGKVEVDEEKGEAFSTVDGKRTSLTDYLKGWAASDEGKHYIAAPVNGGGGASGPGSAIPGTKTLSRSAFDALDPVAKTTFAKEGGKLTD